MPQSVPLSPVSITPAPVIGSPSFQPPTSVIVKVLGSGTRVPDPPVPLPVVPMDPPAPCVVKEMVVVEPPVVRLSACVPPPHANRSN
jgi:hypothetical protein